MTPDELIALLRESRQEIAVAHADLARLLQTRHISDLPARIDVALAERRDSPAAPEVEWKTSLSWGNSAVEGVSDMRVWGWRDQWNWAVTVNYTGTKPTLEEAKNAAIAASKGTN